MALCNATHLLRDSSASNSRAKGLVTNAQMTQRQLPRAMGRLQLLLLLLLQLL
jgi:hypothetical protein